MILRPVSPQSACGPPSSKLPVGLTSISKSSPANCSGSSGRHDVLDEVGLERASMSRPGSCWVEMSTVAKPLRDAVLVLDRHLRLAVGAEVRQRAVLADLGEPLGQPVREPDRHRHEVIGLVAGVAEHHPLVARADLVVVVTVAAAQLERLVDALGDVGRLLVDRGDDAARVAVEPVRRVRVADPANRVADEARDVDVGVGADLAGDDDHAGRAHATRTRHGCPGPPRRWRPGRRR